MVSLVSDRRYAPLPSTFHRFSPCPSTSRKRSKSFTYETFDMEKEISKASLKESRGLLSETNKRHCIDVPDQPSNQDEEHSVVDDVEMGLCAEESCKSLESLHAKADDKKTQQSGTDDLTDVEDSSDEAREKKTVEAYSATLRWPPCAIQEQYRTLQSVGDSGDIDIQSELARACAESAREAFLARHRIVGCRKIFVEQESICNDARVVEEKVETRLPMLLGSNMQTYTPFNLGCSTSPFPRLLASVQMQMSNSRNNGDICDIVAFDRKSIANYGNPDTSDAARACAQSALEAFCARQHRAKNRNLFAPLP